MTTNAVRPPDRCQLEPSMGDDFPGASDWECHLFGIHDCIRVRPIEGNVPNWFWRTMQYLLLGNRWVKVR